MTRRLENASAATLRVCHVIHTLQAGGAEDSLVAMGEEAEKHEIELAVLALLPAADVSIARRLDRLRIPVTTLPLRSRWDPRALHWAVPAVRARRPDVLHTHLKHADIVGAFAARRLGLPMVSTLHLVEDRPRGVLRRVKRRLGARSRATAQVTLAVSEAQRAWYLDEVETDPARVLTVRNGVADPGPDDPEVSRRIRASLGARDGELLVCTVAMMRPDKGHEDILWLAERFGDGSVRFVLVGDGELRGRLERQARERDPAAAPVVFAGFRDDVPAVLAAADLVVHPSRADALPTALIQALAAGRPALAYSVGGVPEIVTPGSGFVVPSGDREELLARLQELVRSRGLREELGRGARLRFEQEFTLERWMGRLRDAYELSIARFRDRREESS